MYTFSILKFGFGSLSPNSGDIYLTLCLYEREKKSRFLFTFFFILPHAQRHCFLHTSAALLNETSKTVHVSPTKKHCFLHMSVALLKVISKIVHVSPTQRNCFLHIYSSSPLKGDFQNYTSALSKAIS